MKTYDSDNEYNSNINSYNSIEEATDLLVNKRGQPLIKCNPELAESFDVIKSIPENQNNYLFRQVLLKNNVMPDSRSQSLPSSLNKKNKVNDIVSSVDCDIHTKLLSENENSTVVQDMWFNTWPERYEKPKPSTETYIPETTDVALNSSMSKTSIINRGTSKTDNKKVTLNEALQNISLAYSPITKQLHLVEREVIEKENIGNQLEKLEKLEYSIEDCCNVGKNKHRRTEASSFSSTVSSLSDISVNGSLLGGEDKSSTLDDDKDGENKKRSSFFNRSMFSWKLFNKTKHDCSLHNSLQRQHVASSSALIQNSRPSNLPAKTLEEDQRHKEEYRAILAAAKKREAQNHVAKQKQQKMQLLIEEQQAYSTKYFLQTVLPNWDSARNTKKTIDLWWNGLPSSVRGKIWKLAIGNELNLTQQLYGICVSRAQTRLSSPAPSHSDNEIDQESSMDVIQLDIARTFPTLCIFQEGGPYSEVLHSLLAAYVCYRPDVGYVQGMSYIAAVLILNMDQLDAFICFANLLNKPLHIAAFTLNQLQMQAYYQAFNEVFNYNLPKLYLHFCKAGLTPDLYLLDWIYTIYAKAMPLDVACRVWDVFLRDGDEFIFRAALGILHLHQDVLLTMDFLHGAQFLTRLPDDLSSDHLFKSIQTVSASIGKQTFQQIVESIMQRVRSKWQRKRLTNSRKAVFSLMLLKMIDLEKASVTRRWWVRPWLIAKKGNLNLVENDFPADPQTICIA